VAGPLQSPGQPHLFRDTVDARSAFSLSGEIEVSLSGTRQDDYTPTGIAAATAINVTLSADTAISGVSGGGKGRYLSICNRAINTKNLTLLARNSNSIAANRFGIAADLMLRPGEGSIFKYSVLQGSDAAAWRCVGAYRDTTTLVTAGDIQLYFGSPDSGVPLAVGNQSRGFMRGAFVATSWRMIGDVSGRAGVRLYSRPGSTYDNASWTAITGGTGAAGDDPVIPPGSINATSSNLSSWSTTAFAVGDVIRGSIFNNLGGQGWIAIQIFGTQTVART
jgi:hypothetical protein